MDSKLIYQHIGLKIQYYRKQMGLSQKYIAEKIGLQRTSLVNIEKGIQKISVDKLYYLVDILNIKISDLLPENTEKLIKEIDLYSREEINEKTLNEVKKLINS